MAGAALGKVSSSSDGGYVLTFQRDFPLSQPKIWKAITAPDLLGCWLSDAEIELRIGGRIRLRGQCSVDGEVLEVRAPDLFKWTWPHPDHPRSEVEISLSALSEAASRMTLSQTDLPRRHVLAVAAGWHTHLEALPMAAIGKRTSFDADRAAMHYRQYATALVL